MKFKTLFNEEKGKFFIAMTHPLLDKYYKYIGVSHKSIENVNELLFKKVPLNVQLITVGKNMSWKEVNKFVDKYENKGYTWFYDKGTQHIDL